MLTLLREKKWKTVASALLSNEQVNISVGTELECRFKRKTFFVTTKKGTFTGDVTLQLTFSSLKVICPEDSEYTSVFLDC